MLSRLVKLSFHSCGRNETDHSYDDDDEKQIDAFVPNRYAKLQSQDSEISGCSSSDDEWSGSEDDGVPSHVVETRGLLQQQTRKHKKVHPQRQVRTMAEAESYLIESVGLLSSESVTAEQTRWMKQMVGFNCLHKGADVDAESGRGKLWLVAIDGSDAAHRGWERAMELVDLTKDHVMVVAVRDKNIPERYASNEAEKLRLRYELRRWACTVILPYARALESLMDPKQYTVVVPEAADERLMLCAMCKRYGVDTLVVGRHARHERNPNHRHVRSLTNYVTKHAPCRQVLVL